MKYNIVGTIIFIEKNIWNDRFLNKFSTKNKKEHEIEITEVIEKENTGNIEIFKWDKKYFYIFRLNYDTMFVDSKKKNGSIITPFYRQVDIINLILQLFYANVINKKVLQFHASLIQIKNYGLMFLGPSGIGKTTQAELWNQYRDALLINGDIVFVQETEDAFWGWGTPWHGSSSYCENANVPVYAIIVLKQSPENSIRELTGIEKVTAASQSVFYPRWLENGMELCFETLDHILKKVPVYELSCRPDEDAVRLTEETIFGKSVI